MSATIENPSQPQLLLLASGDLGRAVADELGGRLDITLLDISAGTHPSLWPHADAIVVCATSERPRVSEAVDATAFVRGIPWVAVHARPTELQVGPLVVPGETACHGCYVRRRAQHGGGRPRPDAAADAQPSGFARHHVAILAALTRQALAEALPAGHVAEDARGRLVGTVRVFNQVTGTLARHRVVAVDCCDRCRARFGDRDRERARMWSTLSAVVARDLGSEPIAAAS